MAKINFLETDSKNRNIRDLYSGTSDFKKGYQPGTNIVSDGKGDLVIDCHGIFARWRNCFSKLLNLHEFNVVRETAKHAAGPLVPEPSAFEFDMAIEKLKINKLPGVDRIPGELIKEGA